MAAAAAAAGQRAWALLREAGIAELPQAASYVAALEADGYSTDALLALLGPDDVAFMLPAHRKAVLAALSRRPRADLETATTEAPGADAPLPAAAADPAPLPPPDSPRSSSTSSSPLDASALLLASIRGELEGFTPASAISSIASCLAAQQLNLGEALALSDAQLSKLLESAELVARLRSFVHNAPARRHQVQVYLEGDDGRPDKANGYLTVDTAQKRLTLARVRGHFARWLCEAALSAFDGEAAGRKEQDEENQSKFFLRMVVEDDSCRVFAEPNGDVLPLNKGPAVFMVPVEYQKERRRPAPATQSFPLQPALVNVARCLVGVAERLFASLSASPSLALDYAAAMKLLGEMLAAQTAYKKKFGQFNISLVRDRPRFFILESLDLDATFCVIGAYSNSNSPLLDHTLANDALWLPLEDLYRALYHRWKDARRFHDEAKKKRIDPNRRFALVVLGHGSAGSLAQASVANLLCRPKWDPGSFGSIVALSFAALNWCDADAALALDKPLLPAVDSGPAHFLLNLVPEASTPSGSLGPAAVPSGRSFAVTGTPALQPIKRLTLAPGREVPLLDSFPVAVPGVPIS